MPGDLQALVRLALVIGFAPQLVEGSSGCSTCHADHDCYNADASSPCYAAGSEKNCLDDHGTYCVEDRSCEDCLAKGMTCFHKNWAQPCYEAGWKEGCEQIGSEWCGTTTQQPVAQSCEDCLAKGMSCFHKNWREPCSAAAWKESCEKIGSEWCGTSTQQPVAQSCEDCMAKDMDCFHKGWREPCYETGTEEGCQQTDGSEFCGTSTLLSASESSPSPLQWIVIACVMLLVFLSLLAYGFWSRKQKPWDADEPVDPKTLHRIDWLRNHSAQLSGSLNQLDDQKGCSRCFASIKRRFLGFCAEHYKFRQEAILAKTALGMAGGPPFWSISVKQLTQFHDDHREMLQRYCDCHGLGPNCEHVCLHNPCPEAANHGSATYIHDEMFEGNKLVANMHAVVSCIIQPKTTVHNGMLGMWARLSEGNPVKAMTFVSHCWNERFSDFVATLNSLPDNTRIWVCSFALPQNLDISGVLGNTPSKSPFALALKRAEKVVLAVDKEVEPATRAWCCFEIYLASITKITIDILAPPQADLGGTQQQYKKIQNKMEETDIKLCRASNPTDEERIRQEIRGREEKVNKTLRDCADRARAFLDNLTSSNPNFV